MMLQSVVAITAYSKHFFLIEVERFEEYHSIGSMKAAKATCFYNTSKQYIQADGNKTKFASDKTRTSPRCTCTHNHIIT